MARYIAKRVALGLVTLFILSLVIFAMSSILPGDVGRRVLGPFADARAVAALNEELGTDRPLLTQYADWIGGVLTGDFGESQAFRRPVGEVLGPAIKNSARLAVLAFIIVVPLAILGGVLAALHEGTLRDRFITVGGLSATAIPEFVWAVVLIIIFSLGLGLLPSTAQFPEGASIFTQVEYLLLPALCLVFVLFGYIARMARAGTTEALEADYTRTAIIKGLPQRTVLRKHVLRNSLLPTIAVVATQVGYLFGGLVIVEVIFNYNGFGRVMYQAAQQRDFPLLQSAVLIIGCVYLIATLVADILYSVLNPRVRLGAAE